MNKFITEEYLASQGLSQRAIPHFWSKVMITKNCWIWTGSRHKQGYGRLNVPGKERHLAMAHRVSFILNCGPIPDGLDVCHSCDYPPCVRPDHLYAGTESQNIRDSVARDRAANQYKPRRAKLTETEVDELRQLYDNGEPTPYLAKHYGITIHQAWMIVTRKSWANI